jgi:hypothetical protein
MRIRNRQYAGSDWIESSFKVELSPLGAKVANFLGDVFLGIYHLNTTSLRKVKWNNPDYIEVTIDQYLSTFDGNNLTKIVVLAHHQLLRVSIQGLGPRYLRLAFHQRTSRDGHLYKRCPHLSDHVIFPAKHL